MVSGVKVLKADPGTSTIKQIMVKIQDEMLESEAIQATVRQAAIQTGRVAVVVLREADSRPTSVQDSIVRPASRLPSFD